MESPQGYKYRGIEQITQHAQPLFAKHGIVLSPYRIEWLEVTNLTINGRPWTDEKLLITYRCYGPGGTNDFIEIVAPGIGRDNADKGSNKAMTQAYKYAMLQALCIADAKDDADAEVAHTADEGGPPMATREQMTRIREVCAQVRERGIEPTETNDEGEVTVLGVTVLAKAGGHLVPALTENDAIGLLAHLADLLLPDGPEEPPSPAPEPEAAPAPTTPEAVTERVPGDREVAAREALARVASSDSPPPTSRRDTKGQLKPFEGESDRAARMRQRVNSLGYQEVHDQLAALGKDVNGRPQAVRQRLLDHLLAQVRAAT
jgi:hypothetical protein